MYAILTAAIAWAHAHKEFARPEAGYGELMARCDAEKVLLDAVSAWDAGPLEKKHQRMIHIVKRVSEGAVSSTELAKELNLCTATIRRSVKELQAQGVPIAGEAGIGYMICRKGASNVVRHGN